jgi:flagellar basal body-associated protein FliL
LLLDLASGNGVQKLEADAQDDLKKALADGGIKDADQALKNIRALALQLEASNPEIPNQVRDGLAILHEAPSDFVARVNSWFDQTIDRISHRFTVYTHWITMGVAIVVVLAVQLDIVAVMDRLWIDDQFRASIVNEATKQFSQEAGTQASATVDPHPYYNLLNNTSLITFPLDSNWWNRLKDVRKIPGMLLSVLLISLGAPFWYNALKSLLKLRSSLTEKDDEQRSQRQGTTDANSDFVPATTSTGAPQPAWLSGERGDLGAVG